MKKIILALLLACAFAFVAKAASYVDLEPVVIGVVRPDRAPYQLSLSFRIEASAEGEQALRANVARVRNDIFLLVNQYIDKKDSYQEVNFNDIKGIVKEYLMKAYGGGQVTDVLLFSAYVR